MTKKNKLLSQIYDLNAIRILVESIQDCYRVLGLIHTQWGYLPQEFVDYIANPKINGYQSIHTAVFGPHQKIIEIQIRTFNMHQNAEIGIAAHWMYKDNCQQHESYQQKLQVLRNLLQPTDVSSNEIFEHTKDEIFGDRIYVFTPKGDVYDLIKGSTALDLAYHIHSDLGHHCSGAKTQGKMLSLTEPLITGSVVEIITSSRNSPSRDWLNPNYGYIKTARARQKITHWFRSLDKGRLIHEGKIYFEKQLKKLAIPAIFSMDELIHKFNFKNKDDFYHAISLGELKIGKILDYFEPDRKQVSLSEKMILNTRINEISFGTLGAGIKHEYASCCNPVFPQMIIGLITRGRGIVIHRSECLNLKGISQAHDRLMFAQWQGLMTEETTQMILLKITAVTHQGLIYNISSVLHNLGIVLHNLISEISKKNQITVITTSFEINTLAQLHLVIDRIQQLNSIIDVERILMN